MRGFLLAKRPELEAEVAADDDDDEALDDLLALDRAIYNCSELLKYFYDEVLENCVDWMHDDDSGSSDSDEDESSEDAHDDADDEAEPEDETDAEVWQPDHADDDDES